MGGARRRCGTSTWSSAVRSTCTHIAGERERIRSRSYMYGTRRIHTVPIFCIRYPSYTYGTGLIYTVPGHGRREQAVRHQHLVQGLSRHLRERESPVIRERARERERESEGAYTVPIVYTYGIGRIYIVPEEEAVRDRHLAQGLSRHLHTRVFRDQLGAYTNSTVYERGRIQKWS